MEEESAHGSDEISQANTPSVVEEPMRISLPDAPNKPEVGEHVEAKSENQGIFPKGRETMRTTKARSKTKRSIFACM